MKDRLLPWFLLFCALGLSGTAAYYSVVGLSVVFVGVALPVIVMGSFLEISKLAIATYLHDKWKETYGVLKIYMTIALVTLSIITSLGIYGLLSTGFSSNIAKLEISGKEVKNIQVKKQRFEDIKKEYQKEKETLDKDISNLRNALSTNTTTQTVDRKTGQLITKANNANRKSFENQLSMAILNRDKMSGKIDGLNDSITKLDIVILEKESKEISGNELGTIKYISEMTGWSVKKTANIFILILIFVFDPLAITLVIATNQAFKTKKKEEETPQVTPQVEDIVDVPQEQEQKHEEVVVPENLLTFAEDFEWDFNGITEVKEEEPIVEEIIDEKPVEEIIEEEPNKEEQPVIVEQPKQLRRLSYSNRSANGSNVRINRF